MGIRLQRAPAKTAVSQRLTVLLRAWGARGRVFESLRPDHIIQGVARFYLATLFYFCRFYPYKTTGSGWNLRLIQRPEFVPEGTSSTSMRPVRPSGRTHVYAELSVLDQLIVALKIANNTLAWTDRAECADRSVREMLNGG